ncbi:MAG TPA: hypothetical protein PLM56_00585 [Cyclobacteriaceae bacterium]|jgi:hypothetical protein|nr:hypothetical protein [Cytophagales bacterium]HNT50520.1 hypothetical protein [Cyclobacteriaceae bacterium]HRE66502.1 hypothetical protein [Cyclobacteriaceae bacterium]HRF31964.1 hypothetical protein [Cyclobacteriaceae bacterium]
MNTRILQHTNRKNLFYVLIAAFMFTLAACNQDEAPDFSPEDTEDASLDAIEDSYYDDADDLVSEAFAGIEDSSNGRKTADERLACATITYEGNGTSGTLSIDFGDGCTGPRGNVRTGVIVVTHSGTWNIAGSSWSISFEDYTINGIEIEGNRTVTVVSYTEELSVFDVTLTEGRVTWPDGRVATREVNRRREHERNENNVLDRLIIYGTAQGTFRNGRGYFIEIVEPLVYTRTCAAAGVFIPVSGIKFIKHGNRELTIDYGDGTCDNIVTLTNKNGRTVRYEVKK